MIGKTIEALNIGESEEFTKTISESDVYLFTFFQAVLFGLIIDLSAGSV